LSIPLKVGFSLLRVPHGAAEERDFAASVLRGRAGEIRLPAVVPVFGRARALHVLTAEEIRSADLTELAEYICGACSCEVKELNPGVDLLVAADWEVLLELGPEPEDLERSRPPAGPVAIPPAPPAESRAAPSGAGRPGTWAWAGLGAAAVLALLTGAFLLRGRPL
ncbi:MAG TPA: hypothetical protein VEJ18_16065, partial [Planctomycetota bacterium]|nr:hypothetical protein [Planctomycetota bacterium]